MVGELWLGGLRARLLLNDELFLGFIRARDIPSGATDTGRFVNISLPHHSAGQLPVSAIPFGSLS